MAQFEDMKNLDLYDDDTIAAAQKGFEKDTNRNKCVDAGLDENERTFSTIIERDDVCKSTSDAEQNDYILPVREVNDEADSLDEMKDLNTSTEDFSKEIPTFTELYNDHDGEQFVVNSASIMDFQIENEIDTCGDEKASFNPRSKNLFGKSRKRSKHLDNHDNLYSKMAEKKKKRPKVYNDHERSQLRMVGKTKKRPKLYDSQSKLIERKRRRSRTGSKMAGKKRKRPSTGKKFILTMWIKNSIALCGFLIICQATSTDGMESCSGESAPVNGSSGPFYDVDKCEKERKTLVCTGKSKLNACILDHDEKSLWAVCTENICLYDQACPEVTRDPHKALVVHTYYHQCQSCNNRESLQGRLNAQGNVGAECLNISGTSPQPIRTDEDDGLVLKVAIPISVIVAIIIAAIGIGCWCFKYRRDRNNQRNINNANPEDGMELQTLNGGAGSELMIRNGGVGFELLTQNGGVGSEHLTQNGGAGSELLTQNGGVGFEILTQNGEEGAELLTQNGGAGSELLTQNGGVGSERLTQNGGEGAELLTQNGGEGSELLTQNGGAGSELLTQNGGEGSELLTQNGGEGAELLTQNRGAGSELLTQNGEEEREVLMQNGGQEVVEV